MSKVCKKEINLANGNIVFMFANGSTHSINTNMLSPEINVMCATHGLNATLTDSYAGSEGNADVAEGMFLARLETLKAGEWSKRRQTVNKAIRVLARIFPDMDMGEISEKWNSKSKAEQKAIVGSPEFKKAEADILREEAEAAMKNADAESPLTL